MEEACICFRVRVRKDDQEEILNAVLRRDGVLQVGNRIKNLGTVLRGWLGQEVLEFLPAEAEDPT